MTVSKDDVNGEAQEEHGPWTRAIAYLLTAAIFLMVAPVLIHLGIDWAIWWWNWAGDLW